MIGQETVVDAVGNLRGYVPFRVARKMSASYCCRYLEVAEQLFGNRQLSGGESRVRIMGTDILASSEFPETSPRCKSLR